MSQMWRCDEPRGLLQSSGLCTMACSLPLAMGYQLARPDRQVIAVMGDAGLEMGIGELATMRDLGLPVLVVVLQDERLALIDLKQRASGRPHPPFRSVRLISWLLRKPMGARACRFSTREQLEAAAIAAFARRGCFTLIAAKIAPDAYEGRL